MISASAHADDSESSGMIVLTPGTRSTPTLPKSMKRRNTIPTSTIARIAATVLAITSSASTMDHAIASPHMITITITSIITTITTTIIMTTIISMTMSTSAPIITTRNLWNHSLYPTPISRKTRQTLPI